MNCFIKVLKKIISTRNGVRNINLYKLNYDNMIEIKSLEKIDIELIDEHNYNKVIEFRGEEYGDVFYNMISKKQIGVFGEKNNQVISHAWSIIQDEVANGMFIKKSNSAMIHFCRVKEEFRGKNIYPFMLNKLIDYVYKLYGIKEYYIWTDDGNYSSEKGLKKIGFEKVNDYNMIYILGRVINKKYLK